MNLETPVYFSCPLCTLIYRTKQISTPEQTTGKFQCVKCSAIVHSWSGSHDFVRWKPIAEKNPDTLRKGETRARA